MEFLKGIATGSIALCLVFGLSLQVAQAANVGETVLVDVTGAAKNWESGTVIRKDAKGYTIRMLGVGEHKGEYQVPEHYIFGYHKNPPAANPPAPDPTNHSPSGSVKVGEMVLADVTGAAKNWETGKIISVDATGYTIEMLGVGQHKGQFRIPEHYIHGYHKTPPPPVATARQPEVVPNPPEPAAKPPVVTPPPVAIVPATAVSGSKNLSGLYLRHEQVFMGTSLSYREDHYLFFTDGRFYHGVPPEGPSNFNWAKEQRAHPELCGQYGINGNTITLSYGGRAPFTWPLKVTGADQMEMNMAPTVKVERFGANARISGNYQRGTTFSARYSQTGAPTVTAAGTYIFDSNGNVSRDNLGAADGDTKVTGVTVAVRQANQGTYSISGNDMTLNLGGQTLRCTVYPIYERGNTQLPVRISIDGALYERKK